MPFLCAAVQELDRFRAGGETAVAPAEVAPTPVVEAATPSPFGGNFGSDESEVGQDEIEAPTEFPTNAFQPRGIAALMDQDEDEAAAAS